MPLNLIYFSSLTNKPLNVANKIESQFKNHKISNLKLKKHSLMK
jgi:hypothetical protein